MSFDLQPIPCDENQWQRVRAKFAADGVEVPDSASGTITKGGVTAQFTWNGSVLRITVTDKKWWYPEDQVTKGLTDFIDNAIAQP